MERNDPNNWPFPAGALEPVRVDSVTEEYAYLATWPPDGDPGSASGNVWPSGPPAPRMCSRSRPRPETPLRCALPSTRSLAGRSSQQDLPNERVAAAMRSGHELARAEGPLHPGTMPQYPVPSATYTESVAVPLTILAVDQGQRGLYAPPRIAVVRWPDLTPVGVGDAPGFDPRHWPPRRLGDWPPHTTREWDQKRLAGTIERFTALWGRLLDAWFGGGPTRSTATSAEKHVACWRCLCRARSSIVYRDLQSSVLAERQVGSQAVSGLVLAPDLARQGDS